MKNKISFRQFLDYICIEDKSTGKVRYPNSSWKKMMYNRYKAIQKQKKQYVHDKLIKETNI